MESIENCKYCGLPTLHSSWHPECRLVHCEGLLREIRTIAKGRKLKGLPKRLVEKIEHYLFLDSLRLEQEKNVEAERAKIEWEAEERENDGCYF